MTAAPRWHRRPSSIGGIGVVTVEVDFDGACPHRLEGVRQEGPVTFRLFPSWRRAPGISEEGLGRSSRLGFRVRHDGAQAAAATFHIDWQYEAVPATTAPVFKSLADYMRHRDYCVVLPPARSAADQPPAAAWQYMLGATEGAVATFVLDLAPGVTEVHWHPPYSYAQSEAFVASLRGQPWAAVERIGESDGGRNLWLIRVTDGSARAKTPFLIRARVHAYESGGSYAMEGMVSYLLSDDPWAAYARRDFAFYVLPMCNPDGVHDGMGRLTAPRGSDMDWIEPDKTDRSAAAMLAAVQRVEPAYFLDLHSWQTKFADGVLWLDAGRRALFFRYLPDFGQHGKVWRVRDPDPLRVPPPARELVGHYCRRTFGAQYIALEFSWFGRTLAQMRSAGARSIRALTLAELAIREGDVAVPPAGYLSR
jgi:hypothetical protein